MYGFGESGDVRVQRGKVNRADSERLQRSSIGFDRQEAEDLLGVRYLGETVSASARTHGRLEKNECEEVSGLSSLKESRVNKHQLCLLKNSKYET